MKASIQKAQKELDQAQIKFDKTIKQVQRRCKHVHVGFADWHNFEYSGGYLAAFRICLDCGLKELGTLWSSETNWNLKDFSGSPKLGNKKGRYIIKMKRNELEKHEI